MNPASFIFRIRLHEWHHLRLTSNLPLQYSFFLIEGKRYKVSLFKEKKNEEKLNKNETTINNLNMNKTQFWSKFNATFNATSCGKSPGLFLFLGGLSQLTLNKSSESFTWSRHASWSCAHSGILFTRYSLWTGRRNLRFADWVIVQFHLVPMGFLEVRYRRADLFRLTILPEASKVYERGWSACCALTVPGLLSDETHTRSPGWRRCSSLTLCRLS